MPDAEKDAPFEPFGSSLPQSRHAFWGDDPSGYCRCVDCEPTSPLPPAPTHTLNEHGTTDCPVERVRAFADDGECSACGGRVLPPASDRGASDV